MTITVDTNVLVSAAVLDDPEQARRAAKLRRDAEIIAVTVPALCEFAWVLMRGYRRATGKVISMIRSLLESAAVRVDRPAMEAGPAMLAAGGDFADGIIAFESRGLGGVVFDQLRPHGGRIDCRDRWRDPREASRWR